MSPQTIKFLTFLQPYYITSLVEIIFLILILNKLKKISNKSWAYGKIYRNNENRINMILNLGLEFIKITYLPGS